MPRLRALHWKKLDCVFKSAGFVFSGQTGSHRRYLKDGCKRPIIIPEYREVCVDIIKANMRSAKMSRETFFELLSKC